MVGEPGIFKAKLLLVGFVCEMVKFEKNGRMVKFGGNGIEDTKIWKLINPLIICHSFVKFFFYNIWFAFLSSPRIFVTLRREVMEVTINRGFSESLNEPI